jgi:DNA-binding response OmpR family regulator
MPINKKILIVEDDEDFLFILEKKFTMEGFSIVVAKDGQEGIVMADKEKPDLVLSDVLMPKMDGIVMARKIREVDAQVPIILLTNIKDSEITIGVQKSGEFDYLVKSDTRINEIVDKVKTKLGIM